MTKATYKSMPNLLAQRIPFTHGSHRAEIIDGIYTVFSYSTLIGQSSSPFNDGHFINQLNDTKYSMTTSRLQNIIRKSWGI